MTAPQPKQGILDISAYVPGESRTTGNLTPIKLSSNETPLGPSPAAVKAFHDTAASLERYPDGSASALRSAIGARYGLNPDRIVCGAGSDELLNLVTSAYLGPGDEGIYTQHGFLVYPIAIRANGGTPVVAAERDLTCDVDAILDCVSERTKIVFLANPNNPTGTYIPIKEVRRLRSSLPEHVVLVLDGAYAEYVRRNDYEAGLELVATTENTVMTRTFSKIYGLAALRLGWAYCPEGITAVLNRIRGPFNLSSPAIAAGVAAIQDQAHVEAAVAHNDRWLDWLTSEIGSLGLKVTPSVANFMLIHFDGRGGLSAAKADEALKARGIILRRVDSYGLGNALRMTVGTEAENKTVVAALKELLAAAKEPEDRQQQAVPR